MDETCIPEILGGSRHFCTLPAFAVVTFQCGGEPLLLTLFFRYFFGQFSDPIFDVVVFDAKSKYAFDTPILAKD
ncbi:hypothetical protein D3C75_1267480 [compost metagenome]